MATIGRDVEPAAAGILAVDDGGASFIRCRDSSGAPAGGRPQPHHPLSGPTTSFCVRPRFQQTVALAPDIARRRILAGLATQAGEFEVKVFPGMIGLHIADAQRRYWSPRLILSFESTPAGTTRIEGIYGPEIEVWSVFLYGYLITGMIGMFSGILGCAQLFVQSTPWGLWVCGAMAVVAALLYLSAQLGQKLGAWQTFALHQAYQAALAGGMAP